MINSVPLILRLMSYCIPAADHAGEIIRDVKKTGELNTVDKGIQDYQTEADRRVNQFILSSISRLFPEVTIVGEEGARRESNDDDNYFLERDESILTKECPEDLLNLVDDQITIWVDPLDGTREYTQGLLEHVTVLIGIAVGGRAVAGVIHQPYYGYEEKENCGRTIWGIVGLGAYGYTPQELPADRVIVTVSRTHFNAVTQESIHSMKGTDVLKVGGAGHKALLLLEGKAHIYLGFACHRWDTCAPEAVLLAAGGFMTNLNGNCYLYDKNVEKNGKGILATARKEDHSKFLNLLPDSVKQSLKN